MSTTLTDAFLDETSALISRRTGLTFPGLRAAGLRAAIHRIRRASEASNPAAWLASLERDPERLDELITDITVGETYFFREPQQFAVIAEEILPAAFRRPDRDGGLRCWSAGCSSGEEPYSLAILLRQLGMQRHATVVGTDLSRVALARARHGSFSPWSLRGVAPEIVAEFFRPARRRFVLDDAIRNAVQFHYLNLAEDVYPSASSGIGGMDLIMCRNVLIYFDEATTVRVVTRLLDALAPQGWLILGSSDPMLSDLVPCDVTMTGAGMMYRRPGEGQRNRWQRPAPRAAIRDEPTPPPLAPLPPPASSTRPPAPTRESAASPVRDHPADLEALLVAISATASLGDVPAAGRRCEAALEQHPGSAALHCLHATLLNAAQRTDAIDAARRAIYLDANLIMGHLALAIAATRAGETTTARRALLRCEQLLASVPDGALVPLSDGASAAELLGMVRAKRTLLQPAFRP